MYRPLFLNHERCIGMKHGRKGWIDGDVYPIDTLKAVPTVHGF